MSRTSSLRKPGSLIHKFALVVLCATLTFSLIPISSPAYGADTLSSTYGVGTNEEHWSDYINDMLEAGDYVEGSALVAVDSSLAGNSNTMLLSITLLSTSLRSTDLLASTGLLASTNLLISAEALMDVSAEAYAIVASGGLEIYETDNSDSGIAKLSLSTLEPDETITISYIESEELSTKEILESLANDPRVLLAQPDYTHEASDDTALDDAVAETISGILDDSSVNDNENATDSEREAQTSSATGKLDDDTGTSSFEPADAAYVEEDIMDLTDYQWGFDNNASTMVSPNSKEGFDIAPTNWDDSTQTNSSGLVAILDTGVDYTHPDLTSVMHDMTQYGDIGGGQYGFNAVDSENADDPMDVGAHGTHVAGIIAATWNEEGTSGAAHGVELVAVRVADEEGNTPDSYTISGFAYVSRAIDAGADIRVINCSWGGYPMSYLLNLAIAELGQKGAISVFAAGNDAIDLDTTQTIASSLYSNPYVVVVSASTQDGTPANFTDYGQVTSNVYAPGASILSTVSNSDASYLAFADSDPVLFETFDEDTTVNGQSSEAADATGITISSDEGGSTLVGELSDGSYRFDQSGTSWKVSTDELEEFSEGYSRFYIQMLVEDDDLDQVAGLSLAFGTDFLDPTHRGTAAYLYVRVVDSSGKKYWAWASASSFGTSWVHLSANLADILTDNDAEGIYLNEDGCIELMVYFGDTAGDPGSGNIYIDVVGAGENFVPYAFYDGTSMAAPTAAGAAAILSDSDEITSINDPAERASALATLLRASTIYYDLLAGTVSSNGQVSLEAETVQGMTPVVASASVETAESAASDSQAAIIIEGSYFGSSAGSVSVGGYEAEVLSWSNSEVVVACPSELTTGTHLIEATASGGGKGTESVTLEISDTISG